MAEIGPNLGRAVEVIAICATAVITVAAYNWRMTKTAKYECDYSEDDDAEETPEGRRDASGS